MKKVFHFLFLLLIVTGSKAQQPKLMLPIGHTARVMNASFFPDGKKIVTTSADGTVKIWDASSEVLLADLKGNKNYVISAQVSPDGKKIVIAIHDGTVKIWDVATGNLVADLKGHKTAVNSAQFSPDGKKIVTASWDHSAKIWDASGGNLLIDLIGHKNAVNSAQFSPDGKKILTVSKDSTVKVWDVSSGHLLADIKGHNNQIECAEFSPDGKKIVTASWDHSARIWDAFTGSLLVDIKGHKNAVISVQFSRDGEKIVTASDDSTAKIWNATSGSLLAELKGHNTRVSSARFSPDGNKIVTASEFGMAKLWETSTGNLVADLTGNRPGVYSAQFSPDGKKIVIGSSDHTAKIWDASSGILLADLNGHTDGFNFAQFSPDGKTVVTASDDSTAKIWDVSRGNLLTDFKGHTSWVNLAQFSPDGKTVVTTSGDSTAKIWDASSGILLADLKGHTDWLHSAQFSRDGKRIVTASSDHTAKIWDASSGNLLVDLKGHKYYVRSAEFSPDGKKILTASGDSTAKIWDASNGNLLADLKGHKYYVRSAEFSPDGKKILTASGDSTAKIWDTFTGNLLADLKGHISFLISAHFSPDGKKIVTAARGAINDTAKIWDASSGNLLTELFGHTDRFNSAEFSPDGKKIVTASDDGRARIWDSFTGNLLVVLSGHKSWFYSAQFSPDGKKVITVSADNTSKIWDAATGKQLYSFFTVDGSEYLITDKDNHYDGTPEARKLLYFTCGTEVVELDQVKDQLWVPNLAERIMKGDSINARTLDELNICGLTPEVADSSYKPGEYCFKILPRRGGLGETVLFLNGIEVKRYKPAELKKSGGIYELKIMKAALKGLFIPGKENRLTVKAFTSDNAVSSRALTISENKSNDKTAPPNLFAVIVGVSDYKGEELDLKFPGKDATDMAAVISGSAKKLLNTDGSEHVFMYNLTTNKDHDQLPEKKSIKKALEEIGIKATAKDILLIFFAGHGVMRGPEDSKQFYFLTADASVSSSYGAVADVGISTSELTEWIKPANIKAQKRILIFDACNSGQAIKDFVKLGTREQGYVAARSDEKSQEIKAIEKLNNQSGLFILSASASNLAAYEMGRYSQGLLTYSLLKAVKQQPDILNEGKYLDVSKWFNAARESVSALSRESGARQDPQIVTNTNFNIGVVDEEVMEKIVLSQEKPLFTACNFQNADENNPVDNLGLNKLIDQQLNGISSNGTDAPLIYAASTTLAEAYTLSGRYSITGNSITVKVFVIQNKEVKRKIDFTGTKDKLDELALQIAASAATWTEKNR